MQWNPWHGCRKISPGCQNCYVYRRDTSVGRDASQVSRNAAFDLPVRRARGGGYKVPAGETLYTCFTSDFFLEQADPWRPQAWEMIRQRPDVHFLMITKRIDRFLAGLPTDWGRGWAHVTVGCTCENQDRADARLPVFLNMPIVHRIIVCEPLLEAIDLSTYLNKARFEQVVAGGESGMQARLCRFEWVLALHAQCAKTDTPFYFKQTGARFEKDGKLYRIARRDQFDQARKAGLNLG